MRTVARGASACAHGLRGPVLDVADPDPLFSSFSRSQTSGSQVLAEAKPEAPGSGAGGGGVTSSSGVAAAAHASQSPDASQPLAKRRRAKRTEEERIEYLRSDPYVAKFEAYRVLCASCDKWIRLRPNSTYCSIPWDAHRKSCLAKRV